MTPQPTTLETTEGLVLTWGLLVIGVVMGIVMPLQRWRFRKLGGWVWLDESGLARMHAGTVWVMAIVGVRHFLVALGFLTGHISWWEASITVAAALACIAAAIVFQLEIISVSARISVVSKGLK